MEHRIHPLAKFHNRGLGPVLIHAGNAIHMFAITMRTWQSADSPPPLLVVYLNTAAKSPDSPAVVQLDPLVVFFFLRKLVGGTTNVHAT